MNTPTAPAPEPSGSDRDAARQGVLDYTRSGLMTVRDFAAAVGLTERAVCTACQEGRLKAVKPSWCNRWLLPASEALRVIEQGGARHE